MSGIAQQGHPATSPATHRPASEEIVTQDGPLVGGLDQAPDGMAPAPEEPREPGLPFPCVVLFTGRAVVGKALVRDYVFDPAPGPAVDISAT